MWSFFSAVLTAFGSSNFVVFSLVVHFNVFFLPNSVHFICKIQYVICCIHFPLLCERTCGEPGLTYRFDNHLVSCLVRLWLLEWSKARNWKCALNFLCCKVEWRIVVSHRNLSQVERSTNIGTNTPCGSFFSLNPLAMEKKKMAAIIPRWPLFPGWK